MKKIITLITIVLIAVINMYGQDSEVASAWKEYEDYSAKFNKAPLFIKSFMVNKKADLKMKAYVAMREAEREKELEDARKEEEAKRKREALEEEFNDWLQQPGAGKDFEFPESIKIGEYVFRSEKYYTPLRPNVLYRFMKQETPEGSIMKYTFGGVWPYAWSEKEMLKKCFTEYFSHHYIQKKTNVFVNPDNDNCLFFLDINRNEAHIYIVKRNMLEEPGTDRARKEQAVRNKADIQNSKPIIF